MSPKGTRKYPRVKVAFRVECVIRNETHHWPASILGGGGLFLETQEALAVGTQVLVTFRPAKHLPFVRAEARVCYLEPGRGVALEFTDITREHRQLLLRLIHHKTADRRKFFRAPLATQIHCEDLMSLAFARDVSHGGMFIETKDPAPVGSRVRLRFNLGDEGPVVKAIAEVTYEVSKLGMGVQFVDLLPADMKRVDAYVTAGMPAASPAPAARSTP